MCPWKKTAPERPPTRAISSRVAERLSRLIRPRVHGGQVRKWARPLSRHAIKGERSGSARLAPAEALRRRGAELVVRRVSSGANVGALRAVGPRSTRAAVACAVHEAADLAIRALRARRAPERRSGALALRHARGCARIGQAARLGRCASAAEQPAGDAAVDARRGASGGPAIRAAPRGTAAAGGDEGKAAEGHRQQVGRIPHDPAPT